MLVQVGICFEADSSRHDTVPVIPFLASVQTESYSPSSRPTHNIIVIAHHALELFNRLFTGAKAGAGRIVHCSSIDVIRYSC